MHQTALTPQPGNYNNVNVWKSREKRREDRRHSLVIHAEDVVQVVLLGFIFNQRLHLRRGTSIKNPSRLPAVSVSYKPGGDSAAAEPFWGSALANHWYNTCFSPSEWTSSQLCQLQLRDGNVPRQLPDSSDWDPSLTINPLRSGGCTAQAGQHQGGGVILHFMT